MQRKYYKLIFPIIDNKLMTLVHVCSKAEIVTSMAEMEAIGHMTPGPVYKTSDYHRKRSMSIKFDLVKSGRLDPIVRTEGTDYYETSNAAQKTSGVRKVPNNVFAKGVKQSFAEQAAKRHKSPGVGSYKISDRSYKMLSPSPGGRKR